MVLLKRGVYFGIDVGAGRDVSQGHAVDLLLPFELLEGLREEAEGVQIKAAGWLDVGLLGPREGHRLVGHDRRRLVVHGRLEGRGLDKGRLRRRVGVMLLLLEAGFADEIRVAARDRLELRLRHVRVQMCLLLLRCLDFPGEETPRTVVLRGHTCLGAKREAGVQLLSLQSAVLCIAD